MDLKKNGRFLSEVRKEQGLTQKQLAECLGISDKTISKWECGNGFPDVSMMEPLCQTLHISVNELISGERISADNYLGKAEENMMNLMKDSVKHRKGTARMILLCISWILGIVAFLFFLAAITENPKGVTIYFDLLGLLEVAIVVILSLCFAGRFKDFGNAFILLFNEAESTQQLDNALKAVSLAEKAFLSGGTFCSVFYIIYILFTEFSSNGTSSLVANLAVALTTLLYGLFGVMILEPMKSRLEKRLNF